MNRDILLKEFFELSPLSKERGYWITKDKGIIAIADITDYHLQNIVNQIRRNKERQEELEAKRDSDMLNSCFSTGENPYSMYPDEVAFCEALEGEYYGDCFDYCGGWD